MTIKKRWKDIYLLFQLVHYLISRGASLVRSKTSTDPIGKLESEYKHHIHDHLLSVSYFVHSFASAIRKQITPVPIGTPTEQHIPGQNTHGV